MISEVESPVEIATSRLQLEPVEQEAPGGERDRDPLDQEGQRRERPQVAASCARTATTPAANESTIDCSA